jgi:hypothetical protein
MGALAGYILGDRQMARDMDEIGVGSVPAVLEQVGIQMGGQSKQMEGPFRT